MNNKLDKRRGTLIGLAVGDALGASVEFQKPGTFVPVTGYRDGGPFNLTKGQWTDDTSMALALTTSIGKGWNLDDQMKEYLEWWNKGKHSVTGECFDIGSTTITALNQYEKTGDLAIKYRGIFGAMSASNGSLMRLAPVAIRYADLYPNKIEELALLADESCYTTHCNEKCRSACRYMAVVLAALINGESRFKVLSPKWSVLDKLNLHPSVLEVARGSFRGKKADEVFGTGYVIDSLEASLWAFHNSSSFEEAVLKAVNLGDDSDTTGAICGQFAGAFWGESGIPAHLKEGLDRKDMIEDALKVIVV